MPPSGDEERLSFMWQELRCDSSEFFDGSSDRGVMLGFQLSFV